MHHVEIVNNLLKELGTSIGVEALALNEKGICAFRYQSYFDFIIEAPEGSNTVFFYSPLLQVSECDSEGLFLKVLKLNFLCLETNGATFAYDTHTGCIILCYRYSIEYLDTFLFQNVVGNFLNVAEKWWKQLQTCTEETPETPVVEVYETYEIRV